MAEPRDLEPDADDTRTVRVSLVPGVQVGRADAARNVPRETLRTKPPGKPAGTVPLARAEPEEPSPVSRTRHTRRTVIIALAVALVVGLGGWWVASGWTDTPPPVETPTTVPSYAQPTPGSPIHMMPVDLEAGLDKPDFVYMFGTGGGVAVFVYNYQIDGSTPEMAVLRGVDIATGTIRWTISRLPDGAAYRITGAEIEADRLILSAAALRSAAAGGDPACPASSAVLVLAVSTGEVLASRVTPSVCPQSADQPWATETAIGYSDGFVMVGRALSGGGQNGLVLTHLAAYRDTDLTTPVREFDVDIDMMDPAWGTWYWSVLLPGGWMKTDHGYVSLIDGRTWDVPFVNADKTVRYAYDTIGDLVVQEGTTTGEFGMYPFSTTVSLTAWTAPGTATPAWTYVAPAGTQISTPSLPVIAGGVMVIREDQFDADGVTVAANLVGLRLSDGTPAWSLPYTIDPGNLQQNCYWTTGGGTISVGGRTSPNQDSICIQTLPDIVAMAVRLEDTDYVLNAAPTGFQLIDATTGRVTATQAQPAGSLVNGMVSCGATLACVLLAGTSKVVGLDLTSPTLDTRFDSFVSLMSGTSLTPDDAGLFGVVIDGGTYQFLRVYE